MRARGVAMLAGGAVAAAAGCSSSELPPTMLGSYHRSDIAALGVEITSAQLQVAPTGLSVTAPEVRATLDVAGKPIAGQRLGGVSSGSALFASVRCEVKTTCTFETKDACEGSLTLDGEDLVVVATGPCSAWAGKWKRGEGRATTAASSAEPGASSAPSVASGAPSSAPSAAPASSADAFEDHVKCNLRCGDEQATCSLKCGGADIACSTACMKRHGECRERCPPL